VVRRIFGPKREEVTAVWRKLFNEVFRKFIHHKLQELNYMTRRTLADPPEVSPELVFAFQGR
jgi:hypothetical protein